MNDPNNQPNYQQSYSFQTQPQQLPQYQSPQNIVPPRQLSVVSLIVCIAALFIIIGTFLVQKETIDDITCGAYTTIDISYCSQSIISMYPNSAQTPGGIHEIKDYSGFQDEDSIDIIGIGLFIGGVLILVGVIPKLLNTKLQIGVNSLNPDYIWVAGSIISILTVWNKFASEFYNISSDNKYDARGRLCDSIGSNSLQCPLEEIYHSQSIPQIGFVIAALGGITAFLCAIIVLWTTIIPSIKAKRKVTNSINHL